MLVLFGFHKLQELQKGAGVTHDPRGTPFESPMVSQNNQPLHFVIRYSLDST